MESLFGQLNRMEFIAFKEKYEQALNLFNVEIRQEGWGYSVFVEDENGNPIMHLVNLSDFDERPKFLVENNTPDAAEYIPYSLVPIRMTNGNEFLKELKIQILRSLTNQSGIQNTTIDKREAYIKNWIGVSSRKIRRYS